MHVNKRFAVAIAALLAFGTGAGGALARPVTLATPLCGVTGVDYTPVAGAATVSPLRIASYNMLHGLTSEGDRTLEARLAIDVNELSASHADIIGIQEAEESTKHGRVIERLANKLAARTQQTWYWCWFRTEPHLNGTPDTRPGGGSKVSDQLAAHYNANESKWYEGAAVLSRFPIVASAVHRLPGEDPATRVATDCKPPHFSGDPTCTVDIVLEPRAAVWTRIATPLGAISFTSTHTSGNWEQSRDLVRWVDRQSRHDRSAFLVCDCNSVQNSRAQRVIRADGWRDVYRTFHATGGASADQDIGAAHPTTTYRIDYVFQRATSQLRAQNATQFMNVPAPSTLEKSGWLWPSDHWGVIATVG